MKRISDILDVLRKQPVAVAATVRAVVYLVSIFGFHLDAKEIIAELTLLEGLSGVVVWRRVTPMPRIPKNASSLLKT